MKEIEKSGNRLLLYRNPEVMVALFLLNGRKKEKHCENRSIILKRAE